MRSARSRTLLAAGLAAGLTLATAVPAHAGAVDLVNEGATLVNLAEFDMFQFSNGVVGNAVVVSDGRLGDRADAFDGGMAITIDGVAVAARNGVAHVEGRDMDYDPVAVGGLKVSTKYRAMPNGSTLRMLVKLTNNTNMDLRRDIGVSSNLGSDSGTVVRSTSSGDALFTVGDRWLVTSDALPDSSDPVVGQVFGGKGHVAPRVTASAANGQNDTFQESSLRVPAKQSRYLLVFCRFASSTSHALTGMDPFNNSTLTKALLDGISSTTRKQILNWDL